MKQNKTKIIIGTLICLLPIILGISMWNQLPSQLPIHWNSRGEVDNYAPKTFTVFGLPLIMAAINLICHLAVRYEKRRENYSKKLNYLIFWIIPAITLILYPITLFTALGKNIPVEIIIPSLVSALLIYVGNYLPKCKQNSTMGIRIPWTLKSEENWNKTHRMGGRLWTACGIIGLAASLASMPQIFLATLFPMIAAPIIYSYILHKKGI